MEPVTLSALLGIGTKLIDRLIPDKAKAAEAKLKLLELEQTGQLEALRAEVQLAAGQLEINKAEAASRHPWTAGWRPFIGWICGAALAYQFVLLQIIQWGMAIWAPDITPPPALDLGPLMSLLFGMLGLGTLRTYEKMKGVTK